jgi:hypothetical protein
MACSGDRRVMQKDKVSLLFMGMFDRPRQGHPTGYAQLLSMFPRALLGIALLAFAGILANRGSFCALSRPWRWQSNLWVSGLPCWVLGGRSAMRIMGKTPKPSPGRLVITQHSCGSRR